jgi:hypothetical protein
MTRHEHAKSHRPTSADAPVVVPKRPQRPEPVLIALQRLAGNAAVTVAIQRRTEPGEGQSQGGHLPTHDIRPAKPARTPPGVAEHLVTAVELADMPAVGDVPALIAEYKQIHADRDARRAEAEKAAKEGKVADPAAPEFTRDEQARLDEIDRRLKARMKGDEEETLKANGITTGHQAWFAEVKTITFLDHDIVCHRLLAERLQRAQNALQGETPPTNGWFRHAHSLRGPGESLHSFGLAIDIDGERNPYLVNPDAPKATVVEKAERSRPIADVINRAMLLVEGKTPAEADLQSRPADPDKDARAMASYDKLQTASTALETYLTLDRADQRDALDAKILALATKDSRDVKKWVAQIKVDRRTLQSLARGKSWSQPDTGFLHLDRRLVAALTSTPGGGLTWLGDDTIGSGRDIMHFDMRGAGPIRRIVKSLEGATVSLGGG